MRPAQLHVFAVAILALAGTPDAVRNDRDIIELPKGRLIFAARGPARMV